MYLSEAGTAVADRETDRFKLHQKGNDILTSFTNRVEQVRREWVEFEGALRIDTKARPALPKTIIEILYADVTKKSKSIALSSAFGSGYEQNVERFRKRLAHTPTALTEFDELFARILKAKDPDHVSTTNV